jgi:uncharacterized membrane protein
VRAPSALRATADGGRRYGRFVLAISGWLVVVLVALRVGSPVRAPVAFLFVLSCPGAAVVRNWPGEDGLERLVLAVGVSMALAMIVAETLIETHTWSALLALSALALITTVGSLLPSAARPRRSGAS